LPQDDKLNGMLNDPDFGERDEPDDHIDRGQGAADGADGGNFARRNQLVALFPQ
jgi:hypothetical protein